MPPAMITTLRDPVIKQPNAPSINSVVAIFLTFLYVFFPIRTKDSVNVTTKMQKSPKGVRYENTLHTRAAPPTVAIPFFISVAYLFMYAVGGLAYWTIARISTTKAMIAPYLRKVFSSSLLLIHKGTTETRIIGVTYWIMVMPPTMKPFIRNVMHVAEKMTVQL